MDREERAAMVASSQTSTLSKGVTTRKGRRWNGATVAKFLSSPGAKRYRSVEKSGAPGAAEG